MKGWYGQGYQHGLASKGIKTKIESRGHRIPFEQIKQATLDKLHDWSQEYRNEGDEYNAEIYDKAFYSVIECDRIREIQRALVDTGVAGDGLDASNIMFSALVEEYA